MTVSILSCGSGLNENGHSRNRGQQSCTQRTPGTCRGPPLRAAHGGGATLWGRTFGRTEVPKHLERASESALNRLFRDFQDIQPEGEAIRVLLFSLRAPYQLPASWEFYTPTGIPTCRPQGSYGSRGWRKGSHKNTAEPQQSCHSRSRPLAERRFQVPNTPCHGDLSRVLV